MKRITRIFSLVLVTLFVLIAPAMAYEEFSKGSKGAEVVKLQNRLNELGYSVGTADGIWGKKTNGAVVLFQKINSLPETGVADQHTQELLYSDKAVYNLEALPGLSVADVFETQISKAPSSCKMNRDYTYEHYDSIDEYLEDFDISNPASPSISGWNVYIGVSDKATGTTHVYIYDELNYIDIYDSSKGNSEKTLEHLTWWRNLVGQIQSLKGKYTFKHLEAKSNGNTFDLNDASQLTAYLDDIDESISWMEALSALKDIDTNGDGYLSADEIFK